MDKIFEKKEYVVSGPFGICIVENITKLVSGREQQMEYYVLRSISDKTKKCYIPVKEHETVLRVPMTEEEARSLLERIKMTLKKAADNFEGETVDKTGEENTEEKVVTRNDAESNVEEQVSEKNGENLLQISGIFTLLDAKEMLESGNPEEWAKAVCYLYQNASSIDSQMEDVLQKIWKNLREELAFALKRTQEEICGYIDRNYKKTI